MAGETKQVFDTTLGTSGIVTVCSLAAALANAANTYNGLASYTQTLLDNSTLGYLFAKMVLGVPDTFAAAPTAGSLIELWMYEEDIDGTTDETPVPASADIIYRARYMGAWIIPAQDVATVKPITIDMKGVRKARFDIRNQSGQSLSYTSNPITVKAQMFTYGPA